MAEIETHERIKQKAHDLFMQYGLRSVSMDDIAQNLGISKKTIYQYYKDKDELIDEVVSEKIQCNQAICESDCQASRNAVHEIFMAMNMTLELFRSMNPALLYDMQKYYPGAFQKFLDHKKNFLYNIIYDNIIRGINEGLYRAEINPEIVARYRIESMMFPFNPEFQNNEYTLAEMQEEFIIHYLFGLASLKGYKLIMKYQKERAKTLTHAKN